AYDEIVEMLGRTNAPGAAAAVVDAAVVEDAPADTAELLTTRCITLSGTARTRDEAITEAGQLLVAAGAVDAAYVASMHDREKSVSTHMGSRLAIPHGTNEAKASIRRSAISFVRYPEGIEWNGKPTTFVIGIAGVGDEHLSLLQRIAHVFLDKSKVAALEAATTPEQVQAILAAG
ncbi:MAG TPA: PTS sugar transporter subunit IIA, partial [Dermatophilaceae bacterium]|nr:PTS sugar transporter subunit IIA [Dermatophilaceae bacterium]